MAKCTLEGEALKRLAEHIAVDIKNEMAKKKAVPFNLKDYMNKIYDLVMQRNGDSNLAAAYAKAIPSIANRFQSIDSAFRNYVKGDIINIIDQADLYKDEENNKVLDFLGRVEKVEETPAQKKEIADSTLNAKYIAPVAPPVRGPRNWFQALPESFKTSTTAEALSINPGDPNYNVPHPGEIEKLKNAVQRKVVDLFHGGKVNSNYGVEYEGVDGGIYLTALSDANKKLDYDKLPESRKEYWEKNGGEEAFKSNDLGVELVFTDSDGEIIYFDKALKATSKEEGWPVILSLRGAKLVGEVDKGVMPIEDFALRLQKTMKLEGQDGYNQAMTEAKRIRAQEEALVKRIRTYLKNNPQESITFPITGGSTGYIETNMENMINVSSIKNIDDFVLSINDKGFATLVMKSTGDEIPVYRNKQTKDFSRTLVEYVLYPLIDGTTNKPVTIEEKKQILANYYNPALVNIDSVSNTLRVKVGSQYVKASLNEPTPENIELMASALSEYYLDSMIYDPISKKTVEITKAIYDSKKASQKIKVFNPNSSQRIVGKFVEKDGKYYQVKQIDAGQNREALQSNQFKSIYALYLTGDKPKVVYSETVPYSDYVKKTLSTSAQLNGQGNIVKLHPYVNWEIYSGTKADQQVNSNHGAVPTSMTSDAYDEANEVMDSPSDTGIDTESSDKAESVYDTILKNKSLFEKSTRTKINEKKAAKEFLDNAEKWYNSTDLAKHIPFKVIFNAINTANPNAVATWDENGITLLKGSDMSDLYHEAWHGFTQLFLTKEQKDKLYAEARKQSGSFVDYKGTRVEFKNASNLQLEEHLAEGFREYVISGGKKVLDQTPVRKSIFQKILAFLKSLFGKVSYNQAIGEIRSTAAIKDIYEKLYLGSLNEYKFDPRNVEFQVLTKGMEAINEKERNEHSISTRDSLLISNSVDAVISDLTYKLALAKNAAISYNILARADARSLVYKQVKAVFEETLAQKQKELSSVTKDLSGYENYSGNAEGADKYWAQRGYEYGLGKQVDFTTDSYDQLDDELKEETEAAYKTAVSRLGRKELAEDTPAGKLVRRDYLQVKYSDAVFAVSDIILPGEKGKPVKGKRYENNTKKAIVDGGTGYAVQMAIDLGKPVYVFHQGTLADNTTKVGWYEWNGTEFEAMDTPALTQKYAGVGSRQLNDAGKKAIEDVYKFTIDIIEPSANSTSLKKQDLQNQIRILTYAIDNFGDTDNIFKNPFGVGVIGYHRLRSEFLSFEDRFEDELQDERDASGPAFGMGAADQAIEEFLPVEIGYLLRGLKSGKKNALGFDVPLNEKLVIYKFIRTIAGNNGVTDIYNRLVKASEEFTPFKELLVKIGDPMSPVGGIQKIWNAINYVGRVSEAPLKQLTINKITKTYNKEGDLIEVEPTFDIYFGESFGDFQQVQKFWETSFQSSTGRYIKLQDDVRIMNLANVFADFPTKQSALNNKRGFLEAIGIKFSAAKEIDEKLNEIRPDGNSIGRVDRLYDIAKAYQNEGLYPTSISDLIKDNTDLDPSFTNEYTNYNDLANLELSYSDRFSNFSKKTAEDTIQYTITKNNSIFETVNAINASETFPAMVSQPQTRHFDTTRNPATRASVLINSLFNLNTGQKRKDRKGNPVKINIDNISGVSLLENSSEFIDGTALSKLDKPSKLVADIHSLLTTGIVENSRHADKPMSYATSASKIHGTGSNGMLYVDTAKFVSPQSGAESFANIMMRYVIAEHDRINILKNLPDNDPAVNTPLFNKAGREFVIFHGILTEETKKKLYAIETDPYKGSSLLEYLGYTYNDGALVPVSNTDEQITLREEIKDDIKEYFRLKSASLENLYSETNIFDNNLFKSVRRESLRLNINSELLTNDNIKSAIVSSYFANKLINNIELGILVYGDPSQYTHPKLEYSKRIALFGSAGPQPRYDEGFINYVNSDQFGGKKYGKTRGVDKPLSSILNTAVISDDVVNSPFKEKFVERAKIEIGKKFALRRDSIWVNASKEEKEEIIARQAELQYSAYDGMKTNDSQALITFDTYRFIAFALKDWTQQQEDMYQDIIAGKPINRAEVDQVFPVMKLQYAGPLMTNSLPLMAGHKYSLFPLIPSVIKGTKLEQVHNMMIDQNIDYVVPVSGSKISSITKNGKPDQLYVNSVINTDTEFTNNPIFIGYLKKQMNVEPYFKGKSRFATQLRKLGTLGLYDGGVPSDFMPDTQDSSAKRLAWEALSESEKETYSNYRINKEYEESLDRLMEFIQDDLLNEIDWKIIDGVPQGSMENLLKLIEREFIRRGKPMDSLDFLQVDKNGKLVRDLSILSDSGNVERMLIALAEKRLIRQKLKGEGLIQVANSMFEKADYVRFKKPTEEQLKNYGADDLLYYDFTINPNGTYTNTSAAQVKVALQGDFKKLLQHKHNDGKPIKTLDRLNTMLKNEKWLNTGDNRKMITIISARIPVGERNFVEFFEIAQFLPEEAGPIMVVPKELVAKNGGDFDFDKQMSLLPTIERVGDNIKYLQSEVTEAQAQSYYNAIKEKNKDFDRSFVDFYTKLNIGAASNSVLQNLRSIFERPENFIYLTNSSSNYIFDDIVKKYKEEGLESGSVTNYQVDARGNKTKFYTADLKEKASISPTTAFEPEFDLETHSNNNVGKDVVGIVASANGYAPVANRVGLYMNPTRGTGTYEEYLEAASKEPRARSPYDKEVYKTFRLQRLFLDHNSLTTDAKGKLVTGQPTGQPSTQRKTYSGKVTSLQPNQIFVFGSNPEGKHGAGAAKYARDNFGAIYGQGEGLQGQSYALPTKDLRVKENKSLRSISPEDITSNIRKLYDVARQNPTKEFLVSDYSESNLNGYTGQEMADMFVKAGPIPSNIVFNKNFDKLITTQPSTQPLVQSVGEVKPENISSKGSEFAKKLTNVGNTVGLTYKGKEYVNSEHAYQTWKSGEFNQKGYDLKGGKVRGGKIGDTFSIMTDILTEKLKQHPELIEGINKRGGLTYIEQSTHNVIGDKFWESTGQNKFIEALAQAYKNVTLTQSFISPEIEEGVYNAISLSNLNDVNNNNPNSEVGSQTLNGGLDVAKDPWLFYININKEAAPVLMFLKQAGVDIENAIALINQPIIKEYLRLLKAVKSPVAAIQGIEPSNPNYYRLKAREIILSDPKYGFNQSLDVVAGPGSPSRIYELLLNYTEGYSSADFTLDSLNASKSLEFGDPKVKAILAHYIEIEETSKFYSKLIRNTSMDTSTESSLISAINKDLMFGDLYSDNAFPKEKLDMIASESQISSFFNRKLIVGLYKDLFEFRDHPKIIEFLTKKLKSSEFKEFANAAYGDEIENALAGFQDAVTNYVFQKALVNVNLVDGYYKGITSRDSIKTKKVGEIVSFPAAVIVENGVSVMYYNMDIINRQYEKAWSRTFPTLRSYQTYVFEKAYQKHINSFNEYAESQDFKERKTKLKETVKRRANEIQKEKLSDKRLLPLTDVARFKQLSGKGRELETYFPTDYIKKSGYPQSTTFILNENGLYDLINQATGEIFNSNVDLKDGFEYNVNVVKNIAESKKDYNDRLNRLTYDGYLTSVALKNTFNIYHLFYSNESFAQEFYNFKAKYPKLSNNYMIFSILEKSNSKTSDLQNLVIKGGQFDGKSLDIIHDNIRELANYNKMLVEAPKFGITDKLEIAKLADMFKRFTYFAYLQSGIGGKGAFAIQNLGLQGLYSNLMTSPSNPNNPGSRSVLKNFTETMNEDLLNTIYEKFKDNVSSERKFRLQNYETRVITRPASEDKFNAYTEGVLLYDGSKFDNSGLAENYFLNAIDNYRLKGGDPSNLVFVINTAVKKKTGKQDYLKSILKDTGATLIAIPVREDFNEKTHFKDETLADNQARIDVVLEELAKERASGKVLVMSNLGYGQNMIGLSEITGKSIPGTGGAQDTFVHLSKELYKKFGYLNNNFKERPEFDIEETDDQTVKDFMKYCLTSGLL